MRIQLMIGAFAALGLLATPAAAQDGQFRVGVLGGWDSVRLSDGTDAESEGDLIYGATVGYDMPFGLSFIGVEAEYAESSVGVEFDDVLVAGDRASLSAGRDLYVGARFGVSTGIVRFYAKGGYANARITGRYFDGTTTLSESLDLDGWRIGAGAEAPLGPMVSVRAEIRQSNYGEVEYQDLGSGITARRTQVVGGLIVGF